MLVSKSDYKDNLIAYLQAKSRNFFLTMLI
ncbi:Uncharacterised protein [Vibrio cholerae]|nr:Uncharacterised protein [Vibrio cholerae]